MHWFRMKRLVLNHYNNPQQASSSIFAIVLDFHETITLTRRYLLIIFRTERLSYQFLYSRRQHSWHCTDILRRRYMLFTLRTERVRWSLLFSLFSCLVGSVMIRNKTSGLPWRYMLIQPYPLTLESKNFIHFLKLQTGKLKKLIIKYC